MASFSVLFSFLIFYIVVASAQQPFIRSPRIQRHRAPSQGSSYINVPDPKATTVKISFGYVNGAKQFRIYAKEWIDGKFEQTVPVDNQTKSEHVRTATLTNLIPGREYLIQVRALTQDGKTIGTISEVVVRTSQRCFECNAVDSNGKCIGKSSITECPHNLDGCLNELRYTNNVPTLSKRCAQYRPELARTVQNGRNVLSACGGLQVKRDAFCKCMCKSDLCNKAEMPCVDECFDDLPIPPGAYLDCSNKVNPNKVGSICVWKCRDQLKLEGIDRSVCRTDRTWSLLSPPKCVGAKPRDEEFECPIIIPEENQDIECTNEVKPGSVCTFSCRNGFKLTGSKTRQCSNSGKWSGTPASCGEIKCPEIRPKANQELECTNKNSIGSVCEFACGSSLKLNGAPTVSCRKDGTWSDTIPLCVEPDCGTPPDVNPHVFIECERMRDGVGRTCTFACEAGYRREGATRSTCYRGNSWTQKSPFCRKLQCQPGMTQPSYGFVRCTDRNYFGSSCSFSCRHGFLLKGAKEAECKQDARWSATKPKCERIVCPRVSQFSYGNLVCNAGTSFGSTCSVSCITGYGLPAGMVTRIQCQAKDPKIEYHPTQSTATSTGAWSHRIQSCERVRCSNLGEDPKNSVVSCNRADKQVLGVTCLYNCVQGYSRVGSSRLSCVKRSDGSSIGQWTGEPPICTRVECPVLPAINHGEIKCSEENLSGSLCQVSCIRGYRLNGNDNPSCTVNGYWTTRFPTCTPVECLRNPFLLNGFFDCGEEIKHFTDDFCKAKCYTGYEIRKEGGATCNEIGEWTQPSSTVCDQINECERKLHDCEQICNDTEGSFFCTCKEGYVLNADGKTCRVAVCDPLDEMEYGKISCSDDWLIGTVCTLACQNGYEPAGVAQTECKVGGRWNKELEPCIRIECPAIKAPSNGKMGCSLGFQFASVCDFECVKGYKVIGTDSVRCEADENWSHDVPKCRKRECPVVYTTIINGLAICTEYNLFESVCRYSCNRGYEFENLDGKGSLNNLQISTCGSEGDWDNSKPRCVRKNCKPSVEYLRSQRSDSTIKCSDGDLFGSTCQIGCDKGYEVNGAIRTNCAGDAEWDKEIGTCEKISCPSFTELSNGVTRCTNAHRYLSTCSFECKEGYELIGDSKSECLSNRKWTNKKPLCKRRTCPMTHLSISFGTAECTDGIFYDSLCSFQCDAGYEFAVKSIKKEDKVLSKKNGVVLSSGLIVKTKITSECTEVGWSREKPACVRHQCAPPSVLLNKQRPNGELECSNGDFYQSNCELGCNRGYEIQRGSNKIACSDDRSWTPSLGYCERVNCTPFKSLMNGDIRCSNGYKFDSLCKFSCDPGYEVTGNKMSTCLSNRTMSHEAPTCEKITCPTSHLKLDNGNASCSDSNRYLSQCLYYCDPGYEMEFSGNVVKHNIYGDMAVLTCRADRTWGGKLPFCRKKKCSLLDGGIIRAKLNGDVFCSESFWFGSVCAVQCHKGYKLVGPASTRCNADAGWSPPIGYCVKRECNALKVPTNGTMSCTDGFKFKSICSFGCDFGFEMRGWDKSECTAEEYFTNAEPFCREIFCPRDYLTMGSGTVVCSNANKYASRCEYECNPGWELTPTSVDVATCEANYKWDAAAKPQCQRKICPATDSSLVKAQVNGVVTCTAGNVFESLCSVNCDDGYELVDGSHITKCLADQTWGPVFGHCIKINCPELSPLVNGVTECSDFTRYQSECSFTCDAGFDKIGADSTVCKADRTYSKKMPTCIKVKCPVSFLETLNAKTKCTEDNYFQSVCTYNCNNGYEITSGSESVQCLSDRTWNSDKAKCTKKVCDKNDKMLMKAAEHGVITCTEQFFFQSVCKLDCHVGYELAPSKVTTGKTKCNSEALWEDELGYCIKVQCASLSAPNNGTMKCTEENKYQSECQFTCDEGFEMVGLPLTECQDTRKWTVSAPKCIKIQCPTTHLSLKNGVASCTDRNRFLSQCDYSCNPGYEMQEDDATKAKCLSTRAWSADVPICTKKLCDPDHPSLVKAKIHGQVLCTDGSRYESVCSLLCHNGWQLTSGVGMTTCGTRATWEGQIGYCERITCDALNEPDDSTMVCSNQFKFESICNFECDKGYEMSGFDSSTCLENGTFSNKEPSCDRIQCSIDYLRLPFGFASCSNDNLFESVCTYSCQRGYKMVGGGITGSDVRYVASTCKHDRSWNVEIPMCEKKTCPHDSDEMIRALENGEVVCTEGNRYQSRCTLICDDGYELSGEGTFTCTETGAWNLPIGFCIKKKCPKYNVPPNTDIQCSDGTFYNSTCTLACNIGYRFEDEELARINLLSTRCSKTATWTLPEPKPCVDDECDASFTNLENGNVTCTNGVKYMSQCHFQCDPGYQMVEKYDEYDYTSVIVTCGSNGSWSTVKKPHCERLTCDPNMQYLDDAMEHGSIKCTSGSTFESECVLTCNQGYEVNNGVSKTKCTTTGNWEPAIGICEKISCPVLEANSNSVLECSDKYLFKSSCRVICNAGYQIYDPENDYNVQDGIDCKADGTWCGTPPPCERVHCPPEYLELSGGEVSCTNENLFESECSYTCLPGYQMTQGQVDKTTCTSHEVWSHPTPTCEKRRCPANDSSILEADRNGEIVCSDENRFDSTCQLHCYSGYELSGEPSTFCKHTGEWSNGIGLCNKISCPEIRSTYSSIMECSEGFKYKSRCDFTCKPGFRETDQSMKDGSSELCQADGTWVGNDIACEKITCPSRGFTLLNNGKITCNDTNLYLSQCLSECNGGYEMAIKIDEDPASVLANCTESGMWDVLVPPVCQRISCQPPITEMSKNIDNGVVKCTTADKFESECELTCDVGYEPMSGSTQTVCGSDKTWSPTITNCQKVICNEPKLPDNAMVMCDELYFYGSTCTVSCMPGYDMVSTFKTTDKLTCQSDRTWAGQPVTCKKIECTKTILSIINGQALCTESNYFGSECDINCDEGYELTSAGQEVTRCQETGFWNVTKIDCKPKTCNSAFSRDGSLICTGTGFNSVCEISCNEGYELNGPVRSTCTDGGDRNKPAKWSPALGQCEKIRCPPQKNDPHGSLSCHDENKYRSVCRLTCDKGFMPPSSSDYHPVSCQSDGTWTREVSKCIPVTCDPTFLQVDYGSVVASDSNLYNSQLKFDCPKIGHVWSGQKIIRCQGNGVWSAPIPRCERNTCKPLYLPNGAAQCDGKRHNDYDSTCNYACENLHELIGSTKTHCQLDGRWSNPTPFCKGHCDITFDNFTLGGVECSNSHYHHSRCNFWCDPEKTGSEDDSFNLYGNNFLTCQEDGKWSGVPPCCAQSCPPHAKMDLFLIFDSSSSVGYQNWRKLLGFANQVISNFNIGDNAVLVGAIRYNRDVDTRSEIPIGKYKDVTELTRAIKYLPYGGWGTHTGEALEHVVKYSIKHPSNRPNIVDVVILFTDGMSQDDVEAPANKLHAQNIITHVVGIENHLGVLNLKQLSQIASRPQRKHTTIVRDGFNHLTQDFSLKLGRAVCENPCRLQKDYRDKTNHYFNFDDDANTLPYIPAVKKSSSPAGI